MTHAVVQHNKGCCYGKTFITVTPQALQDLAKQTKEGTIVRSPLYRCPECNVEVKR